MLNFLNFGVGSPSIINARAAIGQNTKSRCRLWVILSRASALSPNRLSKDFLKNISRSKVIFAFQAGLALGLNSAAKDDCIPRRRQAHILIEFSNPNLCQLSLALARHALHTLPRSS